MLAIRGLLQWVGLWKHIPLATTLFISVLLAIWARLRGLSGPNIALIGIGSFFLITLTAAIAMNTLSRKRVTEPQPESGAAFDGEIYRIIVNPKMGDLSFKLLEGKYVASGRSADDIKTDCDVLVEAYIVNRLQSKIFIRDFVLYMEIDAELRRFTSEQDFVLEDLFGKSTEYGLEEDEDAMREPARLLSLRRKIQAAVDPQEPIEGWVRFSVSSINPRKQYRIAFSVLDSVGAEHPITRTSQSPRKGTLALRRVSSP